MESLVYESLRAATIAAICFALYPPNIKKGYLFIKSYFDRLDELEERIETHIIRGHHANDEYL